MRKILFALTLAVAIAGCTSHKVTVSNDGTTVTSSGDNQTVTVQGNEGTYVAGKGAVDTAKLGLPIYPGANSADNAGYSATSVQGSGAMAALTTTDSFDKVYEWYKSKMPAGSEKMKITADAGSTAVFQIGKETDKVQKSVTISSDKSKTTIMLTSGSKP